MKLLLRLALSCALLLLAWPELARYRAEWQLAQVQRSLEQVLGGKLKDHEAVTAALGAAALAQSTWPALPGDLRPVHLASLALLITRKLPEAALLLEAAIAYGERPELTLSLGRVRGAAGDQAGALRAWIRTAWAQPSAVASLPAAERSAVLAALPALEADLRGGQHAELPPPL